MFLPKAPLELQLPIARRNEFRLEVVWQPASGVVGRTEELKGRQRLVVVLHRCSTLKQPLHGFWV